MRSRNRWSLLFFRRCRRVLFADEHIVPHSKVEKLASAVGHSSRIRLSFTAFTCSLSHPIPSFLMFLVGPSPTKQRSCNMAFVEPLTWMGDVHEMTGKLLCPTERVSCPFPDQK
ncbi:hypothetical protein TGFOU_407160, partial [Toxoplasma gondii FOU]